MDWRNLLKQGTSGFVYNGDTTYSPRTEKGGVYCVRVFNRSTLATLTIDYNGVIITINPNEVHEVFNSTTGYLDENTEVKLNFTSTAVAPATPIFNCVVQVWKFLDKPKGE